MFPTHVSVAPQAPKSIMTLREIDKTAPANAHIMDRFEAGRTSVARVATTVALPNIVVTCTNNGFIQVIDMASGVYRLFVVDIDPKTYVDLPPRCIAIDPTPGLVSAGIGAANVGVREIALVFAPPYSPTIVHASTLTGVVHELISLRSRPSAISIDGDFAVAGDASSEACAWRSGSFSLLWRSSLTADSTSASILNVLQHRETCFFSLSNSTVVVCSVRTGAVLTTLLGGGANIAGIVPTPPFADAVVVASTSGSLTVWAPPLKNLGGNATGTVGPQATSLAALPDSYAGRTWQILSVVDTDLMIKSVSMQNGFLALGGSDGRVALFDATKIAIPSKSKKGNNLPLLVCFDLDHPILHAGVANDNHFSIVTAIGDVWRWPVEQVITNHSSGGAQNNNNKNNHMQDYDQDQDEDYDDEQGARMNDNDDEEEEEENNRRRNHRNNVDDDGDDYEYGEDPREEEKVPTPDTSRDQDQFIYGGGLNNNNNNNNSVARRLMTNNNNNNDPSSFSSSGKDLGLPPLPSHQRQSQQQQQNQQQQQRKHQSLYSGTNSDFDDDENEVEDLADSDIVLTDQNNSGISRITSNPINTTTMTTNGKSSQQQQNQKRRNSDLDDDDEVEDFEGVENRQQQSYAKEWYETNRNNNNNNKNKETVIYVGDDDDEEDLNNNNNKNNANNDDSLLLNNSASALPRPTNQAPKPTPREDNNISSAQQPNHYSSSSGGSTSTPSSRGSQLQQQHQSSSSSSSRPHNHNRNNNQNQNKNTHKHHVDDDGEVEENGEEEEYYEEEEVSPGTTATAESGSSPENNNNGTKKPNNTNSNNKNDDEGVRYHHHDPNSPLKLFGKQQQGENADDMMMKNMQLESDLRGLAHGKRMNPKAADAFLQRAVQIQQGKDIANGEDERSFTGSNHPLSKATPQLSKYLREAEKCGGGPESTVVLQREDLEEFNLQDYADKHRTLVAALEHKHGIKLQQYKRDDVAFYAEELMLLNNNKNNIQDEKEQQEQEQQQEEQQARITNNMNNNYFSSGSPPKQQQQTKKSGTTTSSTAMPLMDQTNQINNNRNNLVMSNNHNNVADDLMPATSKKPLVRRVDPVYERQKKLAGPQLHDHLCSDLLIPPMPSTVFFNDRVPNTKEPKSLVLPLPLPSTPLAF